MDLTDYGLYDELASSSLVSPETLEFLHKTALHPHSPVQIFKRHSAIYLQKVLNVTYVFAAPYVDSLLAALSGAPELVALATFVTMLLSAWVVLGWIRRLMAFATRLVFGLLFWGAVGVVVVGVMQNGVAESVRQAVVLGGKVLGFLSVVKSFWVGELRRYEEEARVQGRR